MSTSEERVALLEERMDHQVEMLADLRAEFHAFRNEMREELATIRRYFEQIDRRFEQVDRRFEQVDRRFEQVDRRFEQVDQRFVWLVGVQMGTLVAIIGVLVGALYR
jgi:predicted RNase H-like nuclease (RuvC/YqgF family)